MLYGLIAVSIIALLLLSYLIYDKVTVKKKQSQKLTMEDISKNNYISENLEKVNELEKQTNLFNDLLNEILRDIDENVILSTYPIQKKIEIIQNTYKAKIENFKTQLDQLYTALEEAKNKEPKVEEVVKKVEIVKFNLNQNEFEKTLESNAQLLEKSNIIQNLIKSKVQQINKKPVNGFKVNGLIAAGPRKAKEDETNADLGEDTCGFIEMGDWIYSWVLDGESDSAPIYNEIGEILFNSRTLAQDMGSELTNTIATSHQEIMVKENLLKIFKSAIKGVEERWNNKIHRSQIDLLDNNAYYGSTLIIACLNKKTNKMFGFRLGDSLLIPFDESGEFLEEGVLLSNKQVKSATYIYYEKGNFYQTELDEKDYQLVEVDDVDSMILFSDGLYTTQNQVDAMKNIKDQPNWLDDFKHKTFDRDDKVLLSVEIIRS